MLDRHFKIRTDHFSLKYMLDQRITTPFQSKWLPKLLGFDYDIEYKKGVDNAAADALSRIKRQWELFSLLAGTLNELLDAVIATWSTAPVLKEIVERLKTNTGQKSKYVWHNHQLRRKDKWVVGQDMELRKKLKGLRKMVKEWVRNCDIFQRNKSDLSASPGLLQPLPIPTRIWQDISMDFIESLPLSSGKSALLVVVDRLSKFAYFLPITHPYIASQVAQLFLDNVYKLLGLPKTILSDMDTIFMSLFWQSLFKMLQVKLKFSTAYNPQTDGHTEIVNKCLETYLRCMTVEKPKDWDCVVEAVDRTLVAREQTLKLLHFNLKKAQDRMKSQADTGRKVAYKLQLPHYAKVHPVFHVLQLKPCYVEAATMEKFPQCDDEGLLAASPLKLLERKTVKQNNRMVVYDLI
nr:hypothetical protein [Tanacetum cinerariifolium]